MQYLPGVVGQRYSASSVIDVDPVTATSSTKAKPDPHQDSGHCACRNTR